METEVNKTQAGFRKGRGPRDHSFNLRNIIEKFREIDEDLHICFIDYSKAFDCVIHKHLWKTLRDMGIHNNIIKLIVNLYAGQQAAVRLECGMSDWFSVSKGVRQGCILSPHLFSLYTEGIMREVEQDSRKDLYNEPNIQGLMSLIIMLCHLRPSLRRRHSIIINDNRGSAPTNTLSQRTQ